MSASEPWFIEEKTNFKRVPHFLLEGNYRKMLSDSEIVLYTHLFDLAHLSFENSKRTGYWVNTNGEVFVHCTLESAQKVLNCGHDKASKVLRELERAGLIKRRSRGNGRTAEIILLKPDYRREKTATATSAQPNLQPRNTSVSSRGISASNNTNEIVPYLNCCANHPHNNTRTREEVECEIKDNISYDVLINDAAMSRRNLEGIMEVIIDTICCANPTVRISGEERDMTAVRERLYALDDMDIRYVLDKLNDMDTPIKSFAGFCLAKLYEAKYASDSYYAAKVKHDFGE